MTVKFFNGEQLIKELIHNKLGENPTIIDVKTRHEYNKKDLLRMRLLDIKAIENFAVC